MNSPFPGMNPYLENPRFFHDFHQRLVIHLSDEIAAHLTDGYFARLDRPTFLGQPDVVVLEADEARRMSAHGAALLEPPLELELIPPALEEERNAFIEIRSQDDEELITVIEVLSPANKRPGTDRDQYEYKRQHLLGSKVNLVEIDLLRRGRRLAVRGLPACDYCIYVSQAERRPLVAVWPFQITDPFPPLFVPLRSGDAPLKIDLGTLFQHVFKRASYARNIYKKPLDPPLNEELTAWANQLVGQ
jgi:hypothetical protein